MDWALVIERNRSALATLVAALIAMAGWRLPPAPGVTLPRSLRFALLRIVRPAESAVRRLIIIAARGLSAPPPSAARGAARGARSAAFKAEPSFPVAWAPRAGARPPARSMAFALLDPLKRFGRLPVRPRVPAHRAPRILSLDRPFVPLPPPPAPPRPDDPVGAHRLALRLAALERALGDIAGEARRLALLRARAAADRALDPAAPLTRRHLPPRRLGHPPGHRRRPRHEVEAILADCDFFAREAERDTG